MIKQVTWDYSYTMDTIPQQSKEHNKLYLFYENLKAGKLTTIKCRDCGDISWPPRTVCPNCISDQLEWVKLPDTGKILYYTVQVSGAPPGYELPLIFAAIELTPEIRFIGRIIETDAEQLAVGQTVRVKAVSVPGDRVLPAFVPEGK
ncbi:MAG: Zn-ribbon domain-containing OB-fold protein [Carboxydocellales bacterium]